LLNAQQVWNPRDIESRYSLCLNWIEVVGILTIEALHENMQLSPKDLSGLSGMRCVRYKAVGIQVLWLQSSFGAPTFLRPDYDYHRHCQNSGLLRSLSRIRSIPGLEYWRWSHQALTDLMLLKARVKGFHRVTEKFTGGLQVISQMFACLIICQRFVNRVLLLLWRGDYILMLVLLLPV